MNLGISIVALVISVATLVFVWWDSWDTVVSMKEKFIEWWKGKKKE